MAGHHFAIGRWDDAAAEVEIIGDLTSPDAVLVCSGIAALMAVSRDERVGAEVALKRAADVPMTMAVTRANSGYVLCARALFKSAAVTLLALVTTLAAVLDPEYSVMDNRYEFLPTLVRLALAADNRDVAGQGTATCEADASSGSTPGKAAAVSHCRGLLDNDAEPLLWAAAHHRSCDRPSKLAQALVDAAAMLASGDRIEEGLGRHSQRRLNSTMVSVPSGTCGEPMRGCGSSGSAGVRAVRASVRAAALTPCPQPNEPSPISWRPVDPIRTSRVSCYCHGEPCRLTCRTFSPQARRSLASGDRPPGGRTRGPSLKCAYHSSMVVI